MPLYAPPFPGHLITPLSAEWIAPTVLGGFVSTGQTLVAGSCYFLPLDVVRPLTVRALGISVTAAQSGGTTTLSVGVYRDDGTLGNPLLPPGPVASGAVAALTSIGNRTVAVSTTLSPGRWWLASLYVVTSAPTTAATVAAYNGNIGLATPIPNGSALTLNSRCRQLTGQSALPTSGTPAGAAGLIPPGVFAQAA